MAVSQKGVALLLDPMKNKDLEETVARAMWFPSYLPLRYEP